jgi:hypothetical protein
LNYELLPGDLDKRVRAQQQLQLLQMQEAQAARALPPLLTPTSPAILQPATLPRSRPSSHQPSPDHTLPEPNHSPAQPQQLPPPPPQPSQQQQPPPPPPPPQQQQQQRHGNYQHPPPPYWYGPDGSLHYAQSPPPQQPHHPLVGMVEHPPAYMHAPMHHASLTECAGCRVLTTQLEREQSRNAKMATDWQKSTNELAGLQARLEERVKEVAEHKQAAKMFEERCTEQQKHALALQAQVVEISAEERRLRLIVADLEARNHALLVSVRTELGALATVAETIGKQVEEGITNDQLIAAALESDQRRAREADDIDDVHDIDGILKNALPVRRAAQPAAQRSIAADSTPRKRPAASQDVADDNADDLPLSQLVTSLAADVSVSPSAPTTVPAAKRTRPAASDDDGHGDKSHHAHDIAMDEDKEAAATSAAAPPQPHAEPPPPPAQQAAPPEPREPVEVPPARKVPASAPRVVDRARGRSVTFEDDKRRNRERALSMGPPSRRGPPPKPSEATAVTPAHRREWQEFREWAARMVTPELIADQAAKLQVWKQTQGLVPPQRPRPVSSSLLQARVRAPLVPMAISRQKKQIAT